jgi:hypothetical protein
VIRRDRNSSHSALLDGEQWPHDVACCRWSGHAHHMQRDRSQLALRDLFSTQTVRGTFSPPSTKPAQEPRHALPTDLPNAVKYLTDDELDHLLAASINEAKRRGRFPPSFQTNLRNDTRRSSTKNRHFTAATVSLTRGQINAVIAAFKAGIRPSQIARQFGIAQSDVHKVLRSETRTETDT